MASDRVATNLEGRAKKVAKELSPCGDKAYSGDAMARAFAEGYGAGCGYVEFGHRGVTWARKRWIQDSTGDVCALIRKFVRLAVSGTKDERSTATAAKVASDTAGARRGTTAAG
jgi:hypothetical protein